MVPNYIYSKFPDILYDMKKIVVGTNNPKKLGSAIKGFQKMFSDEQFVAEIVSVPSGVPDQPMSDEESLKGAQNRAENAKKKKLDADYWVGMEGGIEQRNNEMRAYAWAFIKSKGDQSGKGRTGTFILPSKIARLIKEGKELGDAHDIVFQKQNSKQNEGMIGELTNYKLVREDFYAEAVFLALIPFNRPELYP